MSDLSYATGLSAPSRSNFTPPPTAPDRLDNESGPFLRPGPDQPSSATPPVASDNIRKSVIDKWIAAGATPAAASGIALAVQGESGFNPLNMGDIDPTTGKPTSFGLYQHHNERAVALQKYAASVGGKASDPMIQTDFAIKEAQGGDPIAAKHWDEIKSAATPEEGKRLFSTYFERPKGSLISWGTSLSPALQERAKALEAEADGLKEGYHRDAAELMRLASAAPAGSKERDAQIDKLRRREHEYMDKYEEITKNPPALKPVDAMANFGSAATIVAMLGGLFARRHLTAALSAGGAAMQAINQNNFDQFQREYKIWDVQSTTALQMVKLHNEQVRELIDDKKMAVDEKNSRMQLMFQTLGMTRLADQMAIGVHEKVWTEFAGVERAAKSAAQSKLAFQTSMADMLVAQGVPPEDAYRRAGILPPSSGKSQSQGREADLVKQVDTDVSDFRKKIKEEEGRDPTETEVSKVRYEARLKHESEMAKATARSATGELDEDTIKFLARQYELGDPGVITSLPRSGPARIQVEKQVAADLKDMPDGAAHIVMNRLRMAEARSAATTAGRITMSTELYSKEAALNAAEVIARSEEVPRTELPTVNRAIEAFYRQTGDPKIIRLGSALNALLNTYGKMSNPTGVGIHDADKERVSKILDAALTKGQIREGVDQIVREGMIISAAAEQAQRDLLSRIAPGQGVPPPQAPDPNLPTPPQAGAAATTTIPIPPGAKNDPDGTGYKKGNEIWIKRGDQLVKTPGGVETR